MPVQEHLETKKKEKLSLKNVCLKNDLKLDPELKAKSNLDPEKITPDPKKIIITMDPQH